MTALSAAQIQREANSDSLGICVVCSADSATVCDAAAHRQKGSPLISEPPPDPCIASLRALLAIITKIAGYHTPEELDDIRTARQIVERAP